MIAHAKVKTDTIDAGALAQLYASGFLPEVWIADEATQALRRQVTRRNQVVRQRSRLKNIIQSILHAHLIPACPTVDLCGPKGRAWLSEQILPDDERYAIERHLREFDRLAEDLRVIERDLARSALADESVTRLMTIPGIDMVALALAAAIGDIQRFEAPEKLVSYLGLNPSVSAAFLRPFDDALRDMAPAGNQLGSVVARVLIDASAGALLLDAVSPASSLDHAGQVIGKIPSMECACRTGNFTLTVSGYLHRARCVSARLRSIAQAWTTPWLRVHGFPGLGRFSAGRECRKRPEEAQTQECGSDRQKESAHRFKGRSKDRPVGAKAGSVSPLYPGQPTVSVGYRTDRL